MKNALELLKEFCEACFVKRDAQTALSCLSRDFRWLGAPGRGDIRGIEQAREYITGGIDKSMSVLDPKLSNETLMPLGDGGYIASAYLSVFEVSFRVTAASRAEDGEGKLCSLHVSPAETDNDIMQLRDKQAQLDNLENVIPGGVAKFRMENDRRVLVAHTDGVGLLSGRTREEYEQLISQGIEKTVFPEDAPRVIDAMNRACVSDAPLSVSYRVPLKEGGYTWITASLKRTGFENGFPIIHAVLTPMSYQGQLYQTLAEESGAGIIARDLETYELLYINKAACAMMGIPRIGYTGRKCYDFVHSQPEPCAFCPNARFAKGVMTETEIYTPYRDRYYTIRGTIFDWGGREAVIEYVDDITEIKRSRAIVDDLVRNVSCGLAICRVNEMGAYDIQYLSDSYHTMLEDDERSLMDDYHTDLLTGIHPDDRDMVNEKLRDLAENKRGHEMTYRYILPSGRIKWINVKTNIVVHPDETITTYSTYDDVTEQIKLQHQLSDIIHTVPCGICLFRWDGAELHPLLANSQYSDMLGEDAMEYLKGVESLNYTHIHPDDRDSFRAAAFEGLNTTHSIDHTYRSLNTRTNEYLWVHTRGASVRQPDGTQLVYMSFTDVTPEHRTEQRLRERERELKVKYELERNKPSLGEKNLLAHALFNLTTGETLEYVYQDGTDVPPEDRVAFADGEDKISKLLIDEEELRTFRRLNDRNELLELYAKGESEFSMDYRRRMPDGEIIWVRNILHIIGDPGSSDILLFEYRYDVDDDKNLEQTYLTLANMSYDYVARINCNTKKFITYLKEGMAHGMPPLYGDDADKVALELAEKTVVPEDRETTIRNTTVEGITKNLEKNSVFRFACRMTEPDGSISHKRITAYYLDKKRGLIILTREDVTTLIRAETEKNAMLANALEAANQASLAKSQFLSRMSHELRTPMNAIIGLTALAAGEVNDPDAMENAIGKIGLSARYLLSLINDILEMSRIESGRVILTEAPFDFRQLISTINSIIVGQANLKGLDYEPVVNGVTEGIYIGDATKLQQVLVNVLGNSVKFTPPGGKITLSIEQIRRRNDRATLRFIVTDTGIGIDQDFQASIFDAFSQEQSSYTSTVAGTGLGLAISKSIVEMMNGSISVRSIKGVGSAFTIEVQLGISEESCRQLDMIASMNLSKLRALVVDDDVVVCQSTENILSEMGIKAEWVTSGYLAIERVERAHAEKPDFDAIFIDLKMPDMDGIETTRRIRKIVGPDVTIIIITAYDWKQIEKEARDAGVDLFVEKPLFKSSIAGVLEAALGARRSANKAKEEKTYDFTGKRILLAEDHPLNVEVAVRLLKKAGAEVVVANNGLEALEAFAIADVGYFDALLMDIRMPVMDGLTAAKNIRNLKKEGSRTTPIIAMTANAFDEDVEMSLSHGMDAHLAKPIEPQKLYATLERLMGG